AYFSIDGGATDLARFNQNVAGDTGDWWSNNGLGNSGPNPPVQIQDAFVQPNKHATLGVELRALDAIGYDLVPEPGSISLAAVGLAGLAFYGRRKLASKPGNANCRGGCLRSR